MELGADSGYGWQQSQERVRWRMGSELREEIEMAKEIEMARVARLDRGVARRSNGEIEMERERERERERVGEGDREREGQI